MRLAELIRHVRRKTVVVAMAETESVLECVRLAQQAGLADFILVGDVAQIAALAEKQGLGASGIEMVQTVGEEAACSTATALVRSGKAQVIMKGLAHTASFAHAILDKQQGLMKESSILSQVSIFDIPSYHKALLITDPGINIHPDLGQKVKILKNAIGVMNALGVLAPKVACIAPVETVNPKVSSTVEAQALSRMAGEFGDAIIDGPLGLDAAISLEAAQIKGISSPVAGDPDILMMPEMSSANVLYKSLTMFAGGKVAGIAAGLLAPVVLTSRSDSEETRFLSLQLALSLEIALS